MLKMQSSARRKAYITAMKLLMSVAAVLTCALVVGTILQAADSESALRKTRRDTEVWQRQKRFRTARTARGDCPG